MGLLAGAECLSWGYAGTLLPPNWLVRATVLVLAVTCLTGFFLSVQLAAEQEKLYAMPLIVRNENEWNVIVDPHFRPIVRVRDAKDAWRKIRGRCNGHSLEPDWFVIRMAGGGPLTPEVQRLMNWLQGAEYRGKYAMTVTFRKSADVRWEHPDYDPGPLWNDVINLGPPPGPSYRQLWMEPQARWLWDDYVGYAGGVQPSSPPTQVY